MGKRLIDVEFFKQKLSNDRLSIIDGGSRGALFPPFDTVSEKLMTVLRFEPDPGAEIIQNSDQIIFNKALWNKDEEINLNIAKNPATSSVYPANQLLLENFDDKIGFPPRSKDRAVNIEATSADKAVDELGISLIDFIKLDIHGAEFEAIQGSSKSLKDSCVGLLVESWNIEVHKGQKLNAECENELAKFGFFKFHNTQNMIWQRKQVKGLKSKYQIAGEENLYLLMCNSREDAMALGKSRALKLAMVADLFGFRGYAVQVLKFSADAGFISDSEVKSAEQQITTSNKIKFLDKLIAKSISKLEAIQEKRS